VARVSRLGNELNTAFYGSPRLRSWSRRSSVAESAATSRSHGALARGFCARSPRAAHETDWLSAAFAHRLRAFFEAVLENAARRRVL